MKPSPIKDEEIKALFDISPFYEDEAEFQEKVVMSMRLKNWFRQALVVVSGFVGGLYALTQFIRFPNWTLKGQALYEAPLKVASAKTDATVEAGIEFLDMVARFVADLIYAFSGYLQWLQTPLFFWVSFAFCSAILALYLLNDAQERI